MTVIDEHLDANTWWDTVKDALDTPIGTLVDDFATIADHAIPYGWLPGRARSFYGSDFTTWGDLAEQTITTLVDRPKGGIGTVKAIIIGARAAVTLHRAAPADTNQEAPTATGHLIDRLVDYDYQLLRARGWALRPTTIPMTAQQLGVTQINVQRALRRAYRRFTDLLADPAHAAVTTHARTLRRQLGTLTRETAAAALLAEHGLSIDDAAGQMLLHVAGPYTPNNGWLQNTATGGLNAAHAVVNDALDRHGAPTIDIVVHKLRGIGITSHTAAEFITTRSDLKQFGDKLVRWEGFFTDRVESTLYLLGAPATVALIAALTETLGDPISERAVRNAVWDDPRFMRTTKRTWALRTWGLPEYTGVYSEIAARIDAAGGCVSVHDVIDEMMSTFPDVAESSIRSYLGVPGFILQHGMVRHRTPTDPWPRWAPWNTHRGTYCKGRNHFRIAIPATRDLLRGSGQALKPSIAVALDVHPGEQRTFTGPHDITIQWSPASTSGANFGSLRTIATNLDTHLGDTIVMAFNLPRTPSTPPSSAPPPIPPHD
jgi:hypothetical protein